MKNTQPYRDGLDRLLDDVLAQEPNGTPLWQYRNDPIFHAVALYIIDTSQDGRFSLSKWQQALDLVKAFSAPQPPETPGTPSEGETPRKMAPAAQQKGEETEPEGDRWDGQE